MPGNDRPTAASPAETAPNVVSVPSRTARSQRTLALGRVVSASPLDIEDRALFSQMRAGEASAFTALFERYYDLLRTFADSMVGSARPPRPRRLSKMSS
jgi:hypothetical protein